MLQRRLLAFQLRNILYQGLSVQWGSKNQTPEIQIHPKSKHLYIKRSRLTEPNEPNELVRISSHPSHPKSEPFLIRTTMDHPKTEPVRYSSGYCIIGRYFALQSCN